MGVVFVKFNCTDGRIVFVQPRGVEVVTEQYPGSGIALLVMRSGLYYTVEGSLKAVLRKLDEALTSRQTIPTGRYE